MLNQSLIPELQHEAASTRKLLERVPLEQTAWKPHDRSMSLGQLAVHVAELPGWITFTIGSSEMDFATFDYKPYQPKDREDLLRYFDDVVAEAVKTLKSTNDETLMTPWTMRRGEQVFFTMPRIAVIRSMAMNHLIHHRAQLGVYLRLQNIPIPGMYGPSADEGR